MEPIVKIPLILGSITFILAMLGTVIGSIWQNKLKDNKEKTQELSKYFKIIYFCFFIILSFCLFPVLIWIFIFAQTIIGNQSSTFVKFLSNNFNTIIILIWGLLISTLLAIKQKIKGLFTL